MSEGSSFAEGVVHDLVTTQGQRYFGHIILELGTVEALGLVCTQSLPNAAGCGVLFFVLAVQTSWLWKKVFRHGPLEGIMRRVAG